MSRLPSRTRAKWLTAGIGLLVLAIISRSLLAPAQAAQLGNRQLQLDTTEISATAQYALSFDLSTAGVLGSIQIQFCSNDPLEADPCTAPGGFDDSAAVLASQTGTTGFVISPLSTANNIILTRAPLPAAVGPVSYTFTGIINPSSPGAYFVRVQTFATPNAGGPASDFGGIAFDITNTVSVSAEVPPYLLFCTGVSIPGLNCANASGDYIDFGELSTTQARAASSQMLIATNANVGYTVTVSGTTLASGNNAINAMAVNDVSRPGTPQFGFNLVANVAPPDGSNPSGPGSAAPVPNYNQANNYRFNDGDTIITDAGPDNLREFTASYIVNVPVGQPAGVYVSTLTYVCVAKF